jgi:hypothetical protein
MLVEPLCLDEGGADVCVAVSAPLDCQITDAYEFLVVLSINSRNHFQVFRNVRPSFTFNSCIFFLSTETRYVLLAER